MRKNKINKEAFAQYGGPTYTMVLACNEFVHEWGAEPATKRAFDAEIAAKEKQGYRRFGGHIMRLSHFCPTASTNAWALYEIMIKN